MLARRRTLQSAAADDQRADMTIQYLLVQTGQCKQSVSNNQQSCRNQESSDLKSVKAERERNKNAVMTGSFSSDFISTDKPGIARNLMVRLWLEKLQQMSR